MDDIGRQSRGHQADLVLASLSPRRRELLRYLGLTFTSVATAGEEQQWPLPTELAAALPNFALDREKHPTLLAWRKAQAAIEMGCSGVILGADTIVVVDSLILGKPRDPADACRMLRQLAGRTHTVYTGVALLNTRDPHAYAFDLVRSDVAMCGLTELEIADYVATGEPLDKAGSYGIQGLGGRLVERVDGSYTSVVGLPLSAVHHQLQTMGIRPGVDPADAFRHWLADQGKDVPLCTAP